MTMSKNPAPSLFLGFAAEEKVIRSAQEHAHTVFSLLEKLQEAVRFAVKGNTASRDRSCREIERLEEKADKLRRDMLADLSVSKFEATDRENLVRLTKALDRVADWAHDSSRLLGLVPLSTFSDEYKQVFLKFAELLIKCGTGLHGAVESVLQDTDKAIRMSDLVERTEEEADLLYLEGLSRLPETGRTESAAILIITRDLLHAFENTADAAEDAVDMLRTIIVRQV
jgi:predicted phosphate transport protein (TIGR00153 family)